MIEAIDLQCWHWSLWKRGVGAGYGGPRRVISWWGPAILNPNVANGHRRLRITINEPAAKELDHAIRLLEAHLRRTVRQHYIKGGTKEQKAKAVGCAPRTFYEWLHEAHVAIEKNGFKNMCGKEPKTACISALVS